MSTPSPAVAIDVHDPRRARRAPGLLRAFNDVGVLSAADVHVATRLTSLAGEADELVALGAAFAARGPRLGHVLVDIATIRSTAAVDSDEPVDLSELPWPEPDAWISRLAASPLVAVGEPDAASQLAAVGEDTEPVAARPLRLVGSALYLDRYWREEREVAADLRTFSDGASATVDEPALADGLKRLFPGGEADDRQRMAAATAVLRRFAVVAGGPGTGKTTTVARIVALLAEQAAAVGNPPPLIALAAPTGKAAARLEEAVHDEAAGLDVDEDVRTQLVDLHASTLHRLLGWQPGSHSRFRHHRTNRLPHDVVIVDETSMVSLSLMARLVESVRPEARLVLVGDPGQLTSIEAGAVLGDIVGPATAGPTMRAPAREALERVTGHNILPRTAEPAAGAGIADGIVVLDHVHRFGGGIARLAEAIRRGDPDEVIALLESQPEDVTWIPVDAADPEAETALDVIREEAVTAGRAVVEAAHAGAAHEAIAALGAFRVLCAHRRGPQGVAAWTARIESWLATAIPDFDPNGPAYVGRPLLVTENDYELRLYNGDTGVIVRSSPDRVSATFERGGELLEFTPTRLGATETAFAMTIHKSQGSQLDTAVVLLPAATSRILTRELLYTAATRARSRLILTGTEDTLRDAVTRPVARASGLRSRLRAQ
ncbi:MAG: exodeoxyribonuclease V subunit alpha [Solirubrobacteraceae bacterium]|nr:exodeoxyribonuclease V subunit alpha [Solirubrobacteraceae bacterium]